MQSQIISSISKTNIANREAERSNSKSANGLVKVNYSQIVVREGFNLRQIFEDLEELADSIISEGLRDPLKGDLLKDGTFVLTDGERRFRAIGIARERDKANAKKLEWVPVLLNDKDLTETARLVAMLTTQSNKPFNALEEMEGYNRLLKGWMGEPPMTVTEISVRTGKSVAYIEQKLLLNKASDEEKKLIREDKVKATTMQHLIRSEADSTTREALIKGANAKGMRLKVKDVKNMPAVKQCDAVVNMIDKYLDEWEVDGEQKNFFLDIQAKVNDIKKTIQ